MMTAANGHLPIDESVAYERARGEDFRRNTPTQLGDSTTKCLWPRSGVLSIVSSLRDNLGRAAVTYCPLNPKRTR